MTCYLCRAPIPDDQPFYNDLGHQVCKPCFKEAPRCFVCRFPGREMAQVEGLGWECEFCRGHLIAEGMALAPVILPAAPFLENFGLPIPETLDFAWPTRSELRNMQTGEDLPDEEFVDDFLRFCYPVFFNDGRFYCLRRMTRPTFIAYGLVQLAAAGLAGQYGVPNLSGSSPFHTFVRGFCHYIGFDAAGRLGFELERRQLRKWPELGGQGDFRRWMAMAEFNPAGKMAEFLTANGRALARKHLGDDPASGPAAQKTGESP